MPKTALIDGDVLLFQACCVVGGRTPYWVDLEDGTTEYFDCFKNRREFMGALDEAGIVYWTKDMTSQMVDRGLSLMKQMTNRILEDTGCSEWKIIVSSSDRSVNYRYSVDVNYKAHRPPKPPALKPLRNEAMKKLTHIEETDTGEADDKLGLLQTKDTVICSIDKDLLMIPGMHYNMSTRKVIKVDEFGSLELSKDRKSLKGTGYIWFCAQMLTGDRVDNIPGLPKYGPVKAYNALSSRKTKEGAWNRVRRLYALSGCSEEYLQQQRQLLWILR